MVDFKPNLFGKICFVLVSILIYCIGCKTFHYLHTDYLLIDFPLFLGIVLGISYITAKGIWKLLNSYK